MARLATAPPIDLDDVAIILEGPQLIVIRGSSRKTYQLCIGHHELGYWVTWAEWGRIGNALLATVLYAGPEMTKAWVTASEREQRQVDHGYQVAHRGNPLLESQFPTLIRQARVNQLPKTCKSGPRVNPRLTTPWTVRAPGADDEVPI